MPRTFIYILSGFITSIFAQRSKLNKGNRPCVWAVSLCTAVALDTAPMGPPRPTAEQEMGTVALC